jgi:cell division protein FtsL
MNDVKFPSVTPKGIVLSVLAVVLFLFVYGTASSVMKQSSLSSVGSFAEDSVMLAPSYVQSNKGYAGVPPMDYDGAYNEGYAVSERSAGVSASSFMPSPIPAAPPSGDAKLVKSAYLSLLVKNMDEASLQITALRVRLGGQPGNASFSEYERGVRTGNVTIWVPSARFDEAMVEIKKLALRVENDNTTVSDVSAQFVDLSARLKILKAGEEALVEIMKRSGKISEVLEVTRELNNTRTQIEQIQGQLDYLSRQVDLSSISIALREEATPAGGADEWRPTGVIKEALNETLRDFTRFIDLLLVFIVNLPMLLLVIAFWALLFWIFWKALHMIYRRLHRSFPIVSSQTPVVSTPPSTPIASKKTKV